MSINPEVLGLIDKIRDDKVHGASQLARQAAETLKMAAERSQADSVECFLLGLKEVGERLMLARPAMAPVFNIVSRLIKAVAEEPVGTDLAAIRRFIISKVDEIVEESLQAVAQIARHGSELIGEGDRIMTHSYSSTVVAVLKEGFAKHKSIEVVTTRSGPGRTGESVAQELASYRIPVTFIDDAAVGLYIATVSKVMVGADRVCADGKVINGIGTYQLALAAKRAGIPFYVFCETLKFDPRLEGDDVELEEKGPSEVVGPGKLPPEVKIKNPYFDVTPLELIAGVVTENGLFTPGEVLGYLQKQSTGDS
jgi:eIF-2B alpha/beta/delta-like uncharacterized protein